MLFCFDLRAGKNALRGRSATAPQLSAFAYTARATPRVRSGSSFGVHVAANALQYRMSFDGLLSKYLDSLSPPQVSRASKVPNRVAVGAAVFTKPRGNPSALSLRTIAVRIPGPHHSFSVVT